MFESRISAGATEKQPCSWKLTQTSLHGPLIWKVMQRINCVERYCEQANKTVEQLYKEELEMVCELSQVCSQIVLTCLYLARIGGPDILWSVNKFARAVTKWTRACEKRLARLISYIHHTCESKQCHLVGNTAQTCRSGLFQDSDFCRRS